MGTFDPSRRLKTTQAEVLQAFASRCEQLEGLNSQNVIVTTEDNPPFPGGRFGLAIRGNGGEFTGPSSSQMTEDATVVVGIYVENARDRFGRSESKLFDQDNLYDWKRKIIQHLKIANPELTWRSRDWEPTRTVEDREYPILREPPRLLHSVGPSPIEGESGFWSYIELHFSTVFDWDLYAN